MEPLVTNMEGLPTIHEQFSRRTEGDGVVIRGGGVVSGGDGVDSGGVAVGSGGDRAVTWRCGSRYRMRWGNSNRGCSR